MPNPTHTIPSLSGTFGIPARLTLNPKMPNKPSSPSRSNARIERQYIKNETNRLEKNNGQRTTMYIANKADSRLFDGSSSLHPRRSFCLSYSKNGSAVPKQKRRLISGRISSCLEMPYLPYTSTLAGIIKHTTYGTILQT